MFFKGIRKKDIMKFVYIIVGVLILNQLYIFSLYSLQNLPKHIEYYLLYMSNRKKTDIAHVYLTLLKEQAVYSDNKKNIRRATRILKQHIDKYPTDIYNSRYLSMIGDLYIKQGAEQQALIYYTKSITSSDNNMSPIIDFDKISLLANLEPDLRGKIKYNNILLSKYNSRIDRAKLLYEQGTLYDKLSLWNDAYNMYATLLQENYFVLHKKDQKFFETAFFRYKRRNSKPTPTWASISEAKRALLNAIYSKVSSRVRALQAPGFFTAHWQEPVIDSNAQIPSFNIVAILINSNFRADSKTSSYGNGTEVLWRTYGWERVSTWNMVFRKIQQPDTIELNGRWEWAGIYFGLGNKLYIYDEE